MKYYVLIILAAWFYNSTQGMTMFSARYMIGSLIGYLLFFVLPVWIVVGVVRWWNKKRPIVGDS